MFLLFPCLNRILSMLIFSVYLLCICALDLTESFEHSLRLQGDSPYSHRRLYGIRRLKVLRPIPSLPHIENEILNIRRQQSRSYEEPVPSLPDFVPRAQVPPGLRLLPYSPTIEMETIKTAQISAKGTSAEQTLNAKYNAPPSQDEDVDDYKRKRIEARWRRLGINFRTIPFPYPKTISKKDILENKASEENNEGTNDELRSSISTKTQIQQLNRPDKIRRIKEIKKEYEKDEFTGEQEPQIVEPHLTIPRMVESKKDEIRIAPTPNTRKSVPSLKEDKDNVAGTANHRPRIQGPILKPLNSFEEDAEEPGLGFGSRFGTGVGFGAHPPDFDYVIAHPRQRLVEPSGLPQYSSPFATPPPTSDYHSRTTPTYKSYKFTQKLSQRPRLRIRRPGEKTLTENPNTVQEDPALTPFQNSARSRFGYGSQVANALSMAPVPHHRTIRPPLPGTKVLTTTTTPLPIITSATEIENNGDSGIGVGFGPSELPPELANIGFGIGGGNGINFNVPPTEEKPMRPKQRKQPNPEISKENEPLIIPQNSGLRPVAPPKEFFEGGGGFGSGSGSFGGGGFSGSGGIPLGGEPHVESGDFFTGESANSPSRGPTGDGYGPPIFPGGAVPPAVPAVGLGGAAAGKSPYAALEATENPPTTVKPSALLNVLNKADQGFNQAITHFERGSPIETAAIDIMEVALGSQKLDSQAKLLGHVDRAIGLDNLQRIQRWANTAGAMDIFKEQFAKFAKNFQPHPDLLPTVPPQLEYLFKTSGR